MSNDRVRGKSRPREFDLKPREHRGLSRRRFLQSGTAVAAFSAIDSNAADAGSADAANPHGRFITWPGHGTWDLDVSWLAGNPRLDVSRSKTLTTVTLSGSRYPGSSVSADFTMTVDSASSPAVVELRHALAGAAVKMLLDEWLRGDYTPAVAASKAFLGIEVGEFLRMRQAGEVQVSFNANLALRAQRAQGARDSVVLTGAEVAGEVDAAHVGRVSGEPLIEGESLRRAAVFVPLEPCRELHPRGRNGNPRGFRNRGAPPWLRAP